MVECLPGVQEALILFTNTTNKTRNRLWEDRPVCKSKIVHGHLTYCVSYCVSVIISSSRIVVKRRTKKMQPTFKDLTQLLGFEIAQVSKSKLKSMK